MERRSHFWTAFCVYRIVKPLRSIISNPDSVELLHLYNTYGSNMKTTIKAILQNPEQFAGKIVQVDGVLVVEIDENYPNKIQCVWLEEYGTKSPKEKLKVTLIDTNSHLWKGFISILPRKINYKLNAYRIYDGIRTYGQIYTRSNKSGPQFEILTAVLNRGWYSLFVGNEGISFAEILPESEALKNVNDIRDNLALYLGQHLYIKGTLVLTPSLQSQYLLPVDLSDVKNNQEFIRKSATRVYSWVKDSVKEKYNIDIESPQELETYFSSMLSIILMKDVRATHWLSASMFIDSTDYMSSCITHLAKMNITKSYIKPAVIEGTIDRERVKHFASITSIQSLYIQLEHAILKLRFG